jgi:D-hydroxyproline dehydrogenase subunit gamma
MPDSVTLRIDGKTVKVGRGTTVASAIMIAGGFRRSISGQHRAPLCGMGICFECRATVDGVPHERTCELMCREGMEIRTDA